MENTKNYMTSKLVTALATETMLEACKKMKANNIRHLPVLNDAHAVVGILSDRDVQRAMTVTKKGTNFLECSLAPNLLVEDFMSWPVYVVAESTPLRRVAEEMLSQKVSAFIVESPHHELRGIITTDDLLRYFLRDIEEKNLPMKTIANYFMGPELY